MHICINNLIVEGLLKITDIIGSILFLTFKHMKHIFSAQKLKSIKNIQKANLN